MNIKVIGMKCEHCKKRVEKALSNLEDIEKVHVDLKTGNVKISSKKEIPLSKLQEVIEDIGYEIEK